MAAVAASLLLSTRVNNIVVDVLFRVLVHAAAGLSIISSTSRVGPSSLSSWVLRTMPDLGFHHLLHFLERLGGGGHPPPPLALSPPCSWR